jgi:hypothetical protein
VEQDRASGASQGCSGQPPDGHDDRFAEVKAKADGLLANGDVEGAARTYREFADSPESTESSRCEALFHFAMVQENYASRLDEACQLYVELARRGHAGAIKATQRIV